MDKDFTKIGMPNLGGFGNTLNPVQLAKKIAKTPTLAYTKRVGDHNHRTTIVVDDRKAKSLGDYLQGDDQTKYRRAVLNAVQHQDAIAKYNKEHPDQSLEGQQKAFEKQNAEDNALDYIPGGAGYAFTAIHRIKQLGDMIGAGVDNAMEAGKSLILGSIGRNSEYSLLANANSEYDNSNTTLLQLIKNKSDYEELHKYDTDPTQLQNNELYLAKLNKNILDTYKTATNPELKKASLAYKARYINENGDPIWWKTLKYDLGFEHEDYKKDIDQRYNELINKQYRDNNGVINGKKVKTAKDYANEVNKNYINYLNKENDDLKKDYADKILFLKEALDFFKVSDSYKRGEQLYQNSNLFDPNYWLYVAPGMIGSSNSSPSLLAGNAIQLATTTAAAAASVVATPVVGEAIQYAGTVASIPFLIQGAIDENTQEIGDKRVLNIQSLLNDTSIFGKTGKEDIINDLTKLSILYYKAKGYSDDWIKKNYQSDELTTLKNIIQDNIVGISRNNDPRLKKALLYSQKGLEQQFRSDNVATALELPISIAMQLAPTKYLRSELAESRIGKLVGNANSKLKNVVSKVGNKIGVTTDINKGIVNFTRNMKTNPYQASKYLTRAEIRANELAAVANLHKGIFGSAKRSFNNIWTNKGSEIGKAIGEASGLGYAASSAGKLIGGVTNEAMRLTGKVLPSNLKNAAETFTKYTLDKYQKVYDKLLPSDAARIFAKYGKNLATRTGVSMMNESVEEGKQYIHSIEDYGKLYGYGSASLPDLIANDLAVGGRVLNAYAAMLGLTDSLLKDDKEFAANVMGGAALGGLHTGSVNVVSQYNGAVSDLSTDRLLKEGNIMNREVDKMNRNANVQFATLAMNNKERRTIDWLNSQKEQDSRREAPKFTQEDYDDKLKAATGVMALTKNNKVKLILEAKGIKYGTDRYANAIADIYNRQEALSQNRKESTEGDNQINKLYNSKEFNDAIDDVIKNYNPEDEKSKFNNTILSPIVKNIKTETHPEEATGNALEIDHLRMMLNEVNKLIAKLNLIGLLKTTNKARALIKLKAQLETVDDYYKVAREKLNLKTLRPDAIAVKLNIQTQLDDTKKQLKSIFGDDFDDKADDATILLNIDNLGLTNVQLDQIEQQERTNAMLLADRSINERKLNRLFSGIETNDNGEIATDEKGNVKYNASKDKFNYGKYVDAIMDASERNAKLDWAVGDIYNGDAVNKFEDDEKVNIAKQDDINKQETARQNDLPEVLKQPELEVEQAPKTQVTPEDKLRAIFGKNKEKYEARKAIVKEKFLKRKARYEEWKKGNLNATIVPLQDSLIKAGNSLIKSAELGTYKIGLFISDIKDITEQGDIKQYIPALKQLYIKNISKAELKGNKEVLDNLSNTDEVLSYNEPVDKVQTKDNQRIDTVSGSYAEQVQNKLDDDLKYVDKDLSTFYDTIVTKDGKTTIYTNDPAIKLYKYDNSNIRIKNMVEALNSAKTETEFKDKLKYISNESIPEEDLYKFLKYRNVNGINYAIARYIVLNSVDITLLNKAIAVRNLVSDILTDKEPDLTPFPENVDEFIEEIHRFKSQLKGLGYTVVNTELNIYGTTKDGKNQSALIDVLAVNKNGNIWAIDVLHSYRSIRENYKNRVGYYADYSNEYKENLTMNLIKSILSSSLNNEIKYMSVLPVVWEASDMKRKIYSEINNEDGTYKLIDINDYNEEELKSAKENTKKNVERFKELLSQYKELVNEIKDPNYKSVNYDDHILDDVIDFNSIEQYNNYNTKIDELIHSIQGNINDINDAIETKVEQKGDDNEIYEPDYTIQDLIISNLTDKEYYQQYLIGNLDSSCQELDSLLSILPSLKITTQDEQTTFDKLCNSIFESLIALDQYLLNSTEGFDVTPYEQIIASAIEKLQLNTDNFGNKAVLINKWWCYNFTRVNENTLNDNILYNNYINKLNSWIDALENHIISDDLDNNIKLLTLYSSLLNNYLTKLLSNFNKLDIKDEDRNMLREAMIDSANRLIEDYNYKWGVEPDPNYNGSTEPEMLNAMNVLWKDEHSPSTSHSPAFDAMAMNSVYYYMSIAKDFLSPRSTKLYINTANKDYTYKFGKDSYTIKQGEPYLTIIYTNNDGRVTTANLPFTTNINNYSDATDGLIERIKTANRGNNKLITKLKAMLKYLDKVNKGKKFGDPDFLSIKVDASTNQGSLVYEKNDQKHSVNDFLFNDMNNAHDLNTITLSLENGLGIFVPTYDAKTDTHTYGIYLNRFLKDKIGLFNDLYDKQRSFANPGSIIYFYKTKNGKIVKTALTYEKIGQDNAKSLINLMYEYCVNNKTQIDGYDILDLLKLKLYITDYERQLNKFNDVSNRIILNHNLNIIKIGDDQFDITDHKDQTELLDRISFMNQHVQLETINENIANSENSVFNTTAQRFKDDPNISQITLANGYVMHRDDFINPKGLTWLGYLLKNNYITTGVKGQGYTLINIDRVSIPNTNDKIIANELVTESEIKQDLKKLVSRRRSLFGRLNENSANKTVTINSNGDMRLLNKTRSTSQLDDLLSQVTSYFEQVMGKNGTVKFEDQPYLFEVSKDRVVVGACTTEAINLANSVPMSVAYHEAFHKVFELLLPDKERDDIYNDYKNKHPKLTDKDIAEEFADLFASYMDNKYQFKNAKLYKKILLMFKKIAFSLGFIYKLGPTNAARMLNTYRNMNAGKYKNNEISESKISRFNNMFDNGLAHYEIRNPYKPEEKVEFKYLNNSDDLRDMCSALGYLIIHSQLMDEINPDLSKLKVDQNSIDLIPRSNIEALSGYERDADGKLVDVEDLNDIDRAFREVFERGEDVPVYNKNGNIIGYKHSYPKILVLGKYIADYISSISSNYSDKFIDNEDPTLSEDDKAMSQNIDKFDAVSHQFAKLDSSTQRAKYFFSTIPYCTIEKDEDGSTYLNYDLSKNKFMTPSYMPLVQVFNILSKDLHDVSNLYELQDRLRDMLEYSAMHNYVYQKFNLLMHSLYSYDENGKLKVNYDNEAFALLILNTLRGQKIDFTVALSTTEKDTLNKLIRIKSSSLDRDGRTFANQWNTFLLSGLVRVFKKYRNEFGNLEFVDDKNNENGNDIFSRTSRFLLDLSKVLNGNNDQFNMSLIVDNNNNPIIFDKNNIADIDYLKSNLINRLNNIGIMLTREALDNMLISKYKNSGADGLGKLLSQGGKESINAFINTLNSFVSDNGYINEANIAKGYSNNGFVKDLATYQGIYNRLTINNMALGLNGKRLYSYSQNNSITYITSQLNSGDKDNELIKTLSGFNYNLFKNNDFLIGSTILKQIVSGEKPNIRTHVHIGFKTDNKGDNGSEYSEQSTIEDFMGKFTILQDGNFVFSTMADKGTWHWASGINIPGMKFNENIDNNGNRVVTVENQPLIQFYNQYAFIKPTNTQLSQMVDYAICERQGIFECMEDLGYDEIPGYTKTGKKPIPKEAYVKNYHTKNGNVEPNGTRFLSLTEIYVLENGQFKTINLNDPRMSSTEALKLANKYFFDKSPGEQRLIMTYVLNKLLDRAIQTMLNLGIIYTLDINTGRSKISKDERTLYNLDTDLFDNYQIDALSKKIQTQLFGTDPISGEYMKTCRSLAIASMINDVTIRSIICSQEQMRLYSGHPGMFKVKYGTDKILDSTFDIQKRIGGMESTGDDNVVGLPGDEDDTYTCTECKDYEVASTSDIAKDLKAKFTLCQLREVYAIYTNDWVNPYNMTADLIIEKAKDDPKLSYIVDKAIKDAASYSDAYKSGINVADGASYITADMCEKLLRMRGALTLKVVDAFNILKGGDEYSWMEQSKAYKYIYDEVNIVTTKYTAYGFRNHELNGESQSSVAIPYYNKFALFPLFKCITTGKLGKIYDKMINEGVDMLFMDSAVKVGSQAPVSYDGNTIGLPFNKYKQNYQFLRRQLNTDPEEGSKINMGTQMVKIVLLNLRLNRINYVNENGEHVDGKSILTRMMGAINKLSELGYNDFCEEIGLNQETGEVDELKLSIYLNNLLTTRNADDGIISAIQAVKDENGVYHLKAPLSATTDDTWIESILISTVNKHVIDILTPGSSFVQRSVFAMEGENGEGEIKGVTIYNGKKLLMINSDKSMDAVISIDYFDAILPKRPMSFEEKRQWLIDNEIIGENAKANTIGYRIPTQAQSSIHALRFVDVCPAVKSTIILPEEFTKITGSDFDIDHLYLSSYNYNVQGDDVDTDFDKTDKRYYQNEILSAMLTLLKDTDNSINSLFRSIDNDTEPLIKIAELIPEQDSGKNLSYNFGTLHELILRKNDYITGKTGIGPFALNVTSQELCRIFGVKFKDYIKETGIERLDKLVGDDNIPISSWLSAFINAHVDIVKDPYISKLDVNQFTYNTLNLLVRSGFGDTSVWFLSQPILKEMSYAYNSAKSEYGRDTKHNSSIYAALKEAQELVVAKYATVDELAEHKNSNAQKVQDILFIKNNKELIEEIAKHPTASSVTVKGLEYDVKEVLKKVLFAWNALQPYALALSDLVQHTKIDTKKQGKSLIELNDYLNKYNNLFDDKNSLFDIQSLNNLVYNSWIDYKTNTAIKTVFNVLKGLSFNANKSFLDLVNSTCISLDCPATTDNMTYVSNCILTYYKSAYFVNYAEENIGNSITNMLIGLESVAHLLNYIKDFIRNDEKYSYLSNNALLNAIYTVLERPNGVKNNVEYQNPSFISILDSIDGDRLNTTMVRDAWKDLLTDDDPMINKFAKELIVYSFMTSGQFKGWTKLFKYVPFEWLSGELEDVGHSYNEYIKDLLTNFGNTDKLGGSEWISDLIASNNIDDYRFVKKLNPNNKNSQIAYKDSMIVIARDGEQIGKPYIAVLNTDSYTGNIDGYALYKVLKDQNGEPIKYNLGDPNNNFIVYSRMRQRGYHDNSRFDIYEYGWDFDYNGNGSNNVLHANYDSMSDYIRDIFNRIYTMPRRFENVDKMLRMIKYLTSAQGILVNKDIFFENINRTLNELEYKELINSQSYKDTMNAISTNIEMGSTSKKVQSTNPKDFVMNSGGAYGGDTVWDFYSRKYGITNINHYRDSGNPKLSGTLDKQGIKATILSKEQMDFARSLEKEILGKSYPDDIRGNLLVRNFYLVYNSDGVFAIAALNSNKNGVSGGTNTAVLLGIALNKETHVFDINSESWYKYNPNTKQFEIENTPKLTTKFAGVGTRDIQNYNVLDKDTNKWVTRKQYIGDEKKNAAFNAIDEIMRNTFNNTTNTFNLSSIGNKTELGNVKIVSNIFEHKNDKNIITAFRVDKNLGFVLSFIKYNAIGNPFDWRKVGVDTSFNDFIKWLIGLDFTNYELEYRNLILSNIENLKGKTIEYYKELGKPSHATALDYLINKYDWNTKPRFIDNTEEGSIDFSNTDKLNIDKFRLTGTEDASIWDKDTELQWLKTVLPNMSNEDRLQIVKGLINVANSDKKAWGKFSNGIITLSDIASSGTTYHEAFHAVFNLLLNDNERNSLLNEAKLKYNVKSDIDAEEKMAEDFRKFVLNGGKDTRNISEKLMDFFKSLFVKVKNWNSFKPSMEYYFNAINSGKYSNRELPVKALSQAKARQEEYSKEMQDILDEAPRDSKGNLLAPNDKKSNLTERQYAQVRTKAFKEWFGDWERVAYSSKFRESHNIPNSITSATYQGVFVSEATFDPDMAPDGGKRIIFLGNEYIGEMPIVESKDKIKMSGAIGAATEIEEEYRGKGYGKKAHLALANIAKSEGKTLYSDSSNSDAEDALWKSLVKDGIAEIISESPKVGHWNHTTYRIINDKLPQADDINPGDRGVSKVVDENGEPLVVYHGSDSYGFNIFDPSKSDDKISLFASSSKWVASTYTSFKPLENTAVKSALLKGNAIDLIKNKDWKSLETLINSVIDSNLPRPTKYGLPLPYGNKKALNKIHAIKKELLNSNLSEELHLSLLADLTAAEDEYYYLGNYNFKVKQRTIRGKDQIVISIGDSYNAQFSSTYYTEGGVLFRGSPKELIDTLTFDTKVYDLFFNIKNPLILDNQYNEYRHANNWNNLNFDPAAKDIPNRNIWGELTQGTHKQTKTRDVAAYAKEHGYDGVIFKQIADRGGNMGYETLSPETEGYNLYADTHIGEDSFDATSIYKSDIFIAFNSNKIKSATDNVGDFSTQNDDIRYREAFNTTDKLNILSEEDLRKAEEIKKHCKGE